MGRTRPEVFLRYSPPEVDFLEVNFSHETAEEISDTLVEYGTKYDGIIHCAGAEIIRPLKSARNCRWEDGMMCARSAMGLLAAAAQGIVNPGGSVVLMSSVGAQRGTAGMVAYSAGKGAIEAMTRSAAVELAPMNIRVNAVAAGAFATPMHQRIVNKMAPSSVAAYAQKHPLGFGPVERVRDAVLFLLSDASAWTTGTVMVVDGGFSA